MGNVKTTIPADLSLNEMLARVRSRKGGENLTTTRKTLLLGASLAFVFAGVASATERSREAAAGTPDEASAAAPAVAPTIIERIENGVALVSLNGQEMLLRADGSVSYDEAMEVYGSVDRMTFESHMADVPSTLGSDGARLYANGATGYFSDLLGSNDPKPYPSTVDGLKATTPWVEKVVDGVTVMAFVNNAVINDSSVSFGQPIWASHREMVPNKVDENGVRRYATNAVFVEPAFQPSDTQ